MAWKFYSKKELTKLLGVTESHFHDEIKKIIKKDFKNDLIPLGFGNPDILLNESFIMALADPKNHNNFLETTVSIFDYIENDEDNIR